MQEKNVIQNYTATHFYVTLATNPITYGVRINIKDKNRATEIINQAKQERKEQIEAWNEEQRKRNIKALANI